MTSFPTALHHRIRELARRAPDAPAIAAPFQNDARLSRGALDARAARLARQLRAAGVGAEVRVGVCVERSCELFVALLAVLKAGGVFVPLDPRHPAARLNWIVGDAQLRHGIVDEAGRAALGASFEHAFDAAVDASADADVADGDDDVPVHPRSAAYMIYTSGSTGTPKAVVVEHEPLAAHCDALAAALPIAADDTLLHFASVNFDAAHECWLAPLAVGARVTIAPPQPFAPDAAHALMVRESVSVAAFPPAYLREFAAVAARVGGTPRHALLANSAIEAAVRSADGRIELTLRDGMTGDTRVERFDALVLATGYRRDTHSTLLAGLEPHLGDALARGDVARDYRLATPAHFAPRIYLQGCCEDSHGLSDTLLSVLARRADEICASLEEGIAPAHDDGTARGLHEKRQENGAGAGRMAFAL